MGNNNKGHLHLRFLNHHVEHSFYLRWEVRLNLLKLTFQDNWQNNSQSIFGNLQKVSDWIGSHDRNKVLLLKKTTNKKQVYKYFGIRLINYAMSGHLSSWTSLPWLPWLPWLPCYNLLVCYTTSSPVNPCVTRLLHSWMARVHPVSLLADSGAELGETESAMCISENKGFSKGLQESCDNHVSWDKNTISRSCKTRLSTGLHAAAERRRLFFVHAAATVFKRRIGVKRLFTPNAPFRVFRKTISEQNLTFGISEHNIFW